MGLTPHEYYSMTPAEVILMVRGHLMKVSKEWEQTRQIAYVVESTKARKGSLPRIKDWMPLPSDKFTKESVDMEEMKKEWEIIKAR